MDGWFGALCEALAPISGTALGVVCALLAALVVILIGLGFGPLRPWLGWSSSGERAAQKPWEEHEGVGSMWRLYRHLKRTASLP